MANIDLNHLISSFEQDYIGIEDEKNDQLRNQFITEFPLENIKEMKLEQYALGFKENNLCWWLEYNTTELGGIKGGTANKHKIYYSKKEEKWIFPKQFQDETKAWEALRMELYNFLKEFQTTSSVNIDPNSLIASMNMDRSKLLYMYFSEKLFPIYNVDHLKIILEFFHYDRATIKDWDFLRLNKELKEKKNASDFFREWSVYKFVRFLYAKVVNTSKVYKIAPGEDAKYWQECLDNGYICIEWDETGDLKNYADYNEFKYNFEKIFPQYDKSKITEKSNEVWTFFSLNIGDIVVANKGTSKVLGVGEVVDKGYEFDNSRDKFKHTVHVKWNKKFTEKKIKEQKYWAFKTVFNISEKLYQDIIGDTYMAVKTEPTSAVAPITPEPLLNFSDEEEKFFIQMEKNLLRKGNIILYGPPGTGKTFLSSRFIQWSKQNKNINCVKEFCTFHPSYNYEDFIEGYRPLSNDKGEISFKLTDGIFKDFCNAALVDFQSDYYIIIDEINRGNLEKIFGELITLIEKDKRNMELILSQSKKPFKIPENVFIIGTMNTSDRSIKVFDAALRRRFAFIECMPDYQLISKPLDKLQLSPKDILLKLNAKLREIEDREKQIGHSYFMKNGSQIETIDELKEIYIYEIIPLISEYCFNDYSKMKEIIGEEFIDEKNEELKYELINGNEDFFATEIEKQFGDRRNEIN